MFDKVKGIAVKGGFFEEESTSLGKILSRRMNIVFGRNGSGKSTIARAFAVQKNAGPKKYSVRFCGEAPLPDVAGSNVFVFNEDFIDSNVKIDKIRSIVMFGKNIQLDDAIKVAKEELKTLKADQEAKEKEASNLGIKAGGLKKKIEDEIRKGYLARLGRVDGGEKRLSPKIFETVTGLESVDKTVPLSNSLIDIENRIAEYHKCTKGEKISLIPTAVLPDISRVNALLERTVKPSELTEEESSILSILSGELAGEHFLDKTQDMVIDAKRDFCPLCHQGISHDHRDVLVRRLLRFKDKQVDDFKMEIANQISKLKTVSIQIPDGTDGIDKTVFENLSKAVDDLNEFVKGAVQALQDKLGNPYAPATGVDESVFSNLCADVTTAVDAVNDKISEYNEKLAKVPILRKEIERMNTMLAFREAESFIAEYKRTCSDAETAKDEALKAAAKVTGKQDEIQRMQAQTDEIGTAMKRINDYLRIVFGKDRLTLQSAGNDKYSILSRGREISPKSLSIGERNAIALAYFFACVVERKEEDYEYSEPTLLILDDPVSSFDMENKAGMISLIGQQCSKILKGCDQSKVLILTHDFMTLRDLSVVRNKLAGALGCGASETEEYNELQNGKSRDRKTKDIRENNDYHNRLLNIYHYANADDPRENPFDSNMGSIIRRLLEQYATFRYHKSWFELFSDESLKGLEQSKKDAIQALYMRPVLNPESHGTNEVYQSEEIQRVARMVMAYLYLTDRTHLTSYISDHRQLKNIEQWADDL